MAKLTQKRQLIFNFQMDTHLCEGCCFQREMNEFSLGKNTPVKDVRKQHGRQLIIMKDETNSIIYHVKWLSDVPKVIKYPQNVLKFIYDSIYDETHYSKVMCVTEYKCEGNIFHGDFHYRNTHEWYDWAVIKWEGYSHLLGKIYCFVDMMNCMYI